jgi:hypothetical protein
MVKDKAEIASQVLGLAYMPTFSPIPKSWKESREPIRDRILDKGGDDV